MVQNVISLSSKNRIQPLTHPKGAWSTVRQRILITLSIN